MNLPKRNAYSVSFQAIPSKHKKKFKSIIRQDEGEEELQNRERVRTIDI